MSRATTAERSTGAVEGDQCPNCGDALANVQGIADCITCRFTAD